MTDNDCFDQLLHRTNLGDRKPSELLSKLRTLLGKSCSDSAHLNKLLSKLFLISCASGQHDFDQFPAANFRANC